MKTSNSKLSELASDTTIKTKTIEEKEVALGDKQRELINLNQEMVALRNTVYSLEANDKLVASQVLKDQEKIASLQKKLNAKVSQYHDLNTAFQNLEEEQKKSQSQLKSSEETLEKYKKSIEVFENLRVDYESKISGLTKTIGHLA